MGMYCTGLQIKDTFHSIIFCSSVVSFVAHRLENKSNKNFVLRCDLENCKSETEEATRPSLQALVLGGPDLVLNEGSVFIHSMLSGLNYR